VSIEHGRWLVDFCGPFVETPVDKIKSTQVAVEAFSTWPVSVPGRTQTQTALETPKILSKMFSSFMDVRPSLQTVVHSLSQVP